MSLRTLATQFVLFALLGGACAEATNQTTAADGPTAPSAGSVVFLLDTSGVGGIPFGTDAETTIATVSAVLGRPIFDDTQPDCPGPDRIVEWDGLSVNFLAGSMIGYVSWLDARLTELTKQSLLKPGDPDSQLLALFPNVSIEESAVGRQFFTSVDDSGYYGILEGGAIVSLGAGSPYTCL